MDIYHTSAYVICDLFPQLESLRLNLKKRERMVEELRLSIRSETNLITKVKLVEEIGVYKMYRTWIKD